MGGKGGSKIQVTEYGMSIHYGICTAPAVLRGLIIKEKDVFRGAYMQGVSSTFIDRQELFGGVKKEGGVAGTLHFLGGASDQVLPDVLSQKLGRADGADAPGYRGIASIFLTGEGYSRLTGFYWSANIPYLPGTWAEVESVYHDGQWYPEKVAIVAVGGAYTSSILALSHDFDANDAATTPEGSAGTYTISGVSQYDQIVITFPDDGTYKAWSRWLGYGVGEGYYPGSTSDPLWWWAFSVKNAEGTVTNYGQTSAMTEDGAFALAQAAGETVLSGSTSYKIWLPDDVLFNRGGLSLRIEQRSRIGALDMNPAHIIYECLTNTDWGMGSPIALLDDDAFRAAADTLFDENFGLSMIWTRQAAIQDFIQEVLDHIQGVLYVDPATGLLTLKLIRGDYDPDDLEEITPDNADLTSFSRKLWGEIVNEIVVTWTNPLTEQDETVTAQDLASIVTQGGIVSDSRNYYGVRNATLAGQLAQRDLRASGAPLASCEAEVDRSFWAARPAGCYRVTWPEHGLSDIVMRVTNVDYGRPGDPSIKLSLMEDVFGLDIGEYIEPATSGWEDPSSFPEPLEVERVITLPFFLAADAAGSEDATYPEVISGILATTSNDDTFNYDAWSEVALPDGTLQWQSLGTFNILGYAELTADLDAEAASSGIGFSNVIGQTSPSQGGFVFIGDNDDDETEMEIAMVTDPAAVDLSRGVLDTVPRAWPAGTHVWFVDGTTVFEDVTVRSAGEDAEYKLLSRTSQGLLDIDDADLITYTLTERPYLPNRPANVQIDGVLFNDIATPVDMTGRPDPWVTVDWANRNRLTEDSQVLAWTDATVTPETDQTSIIRVLTADGLTELAVHDELSGTSFDVPDASFAGEAVVLIRVSSSRTDADGTFESLQAHQIWVRVGGESRVTEGGDARLTEGGDNRVTED